MAKKRIVKDYDSLPVQVLAKLKHEYPYGYAENLISFSNAKGEKVSALPFETEDIYYLIRMTRDEAVAIVEDDDDFDELGNLEEGAYEGDDENDDS